MAASRADSTNRPRPACGTDHIASPHTLPPRFLEGCGLHSAAHRAWRASRVAASIMGHLRLERPVGGRIATSYRETCMLRERGDLQRNVRITGGGLRREKKGGDNDEGGMSTQERQEGEVPRCARAIRGRRCPTTKRTGDSEHRQSLRPTRSPIARQASTSRRSSPPPVGEQEPTLSHRINKMRPHRSDNLRRCLTRASRWGRQGGRTDLWTSRHRRSPARGTE